ncbi:MAG: hypothetical protein V4563_17155 [Pseudomonadota bacterium]
MKLLFDDLYPQLQPFTPALVGVTDSPTVTSNLVRMGRLWNVNIEITGSSTASGAYLELPFISFATSLFLIKMDTDATPKVAYIEKNTTRLYLPDWTGVSRVIISGTAGE